MRIPFRKLDKLGSQTPYPTGPLTTGSLHNCHDGHRSLLVLLASGKVRKDKRGGEVTWQQVYRKRKPSTVPLADGNHH